MSSASKPVESETPAQPDVPNKSTIPTWQGEIKPRLLTNQEVSRRIFIGWSRTVPHSILMEAFARFGRYSYIDNNKGNGNHCYLVFESPDSVQAMIHCAHKRKGGLYFDFFYDGKLEHIQVIPWYCQDLYYSNPKVQSVDRSKTAFNTVFIGAIHALLTASAIAEIFEETFGTVAYADLRCDGNSYPIGCGSVTFADTESCRKAVAMGSVDVVTSKFGRRITIDPFVRACPCSVPNCSQLGKVFCKDCFNYFCLGCFQPHPLYHVGVDVLSFRKR
uniref:RRM domain-containing protein n=1 Tax=Panagrellus redivivus TaxID=6233 RepID=A0A7E4W5Q0_PANRE